MYLKYKRKHRIKAVLIMVASVLFFLYILYITLGPTGEKERLNLAAKITLITLWGLFALIHFVRSLKALINSTDPLEKYLKESGITEEELERETQNARKFSSVLIGNQHIFVVASKNFLVFPIANLEGLTVRAYGGASFPSQQNAQAVAGKAAAAVAIHMATGVNTARGRARAGYYYLFFHGKGIPEGSKLYFALWPSLAELVAALEQTKPGLQTEYQWCATS